MRYHDSVGKSPQHRTRRLTQLGAAAMIAGIAVILRYLADTYFVPYVIGWRRPVQNWLMSVGMAWIAPHYALLNLELPTIALAALGGAFIGRAARRRWILLSVANAAGLSIIALSLQLWQLHATGLDVGPLLHGHSMVTGVSMLAAFIPTLVVAWLMSRRARMRLAWEAAGRCGRCGYDLRATTTPRCPECGTIIDQTRGSNFVDSANDS